MTACVVPLGVRTRSDAAGGVFAGVLLAAAFLPLPRFGALLVLIALVPLWRVLGQVPGPRRGAEIGAIFGVTFWALQLSWVPLVAIRIGELWPLMAWVGQVALLGLLGAAVGGGFVLLRQRGAPIPAAAGLAWVGVEWARGHLLGPLSFPWSGIALPLARIPVLAQPAAWGGESLLACGVVVVSAALAGAGGGRDSGRSAGRRLWSGTVLPLALVSLWAGLGFLRIRLMEPQIRPRARVVVVQPGLSLAEKRGAGAEERALGSLRSGLVEAGVLVDGGAGDLVVFPETHLPLVFGGDGGVETVGSTGAGLAGQGRVPGPRAWPSELTTELQRWASLHGAELLVGAYRRDGAGTRNALLRVGPDGVVGFYDKVALVPGVERGPGGLVPGDDVRPLAVEGRPGVLICIESAWAGLALEQARAGAGWLLNVTNDAWLGEELDGSGTTTPAFHQHPWHLILRSVETGRGAVRVGNNGLTGTVDPMGRWSLALPPHQPGVAAVVVEGLDTPSIFLRGGNRFGLVAFLLLLFAPIVPKPDPR